MPKPRRRLATHAKLRGQTPPRPGAFDETSPRRVAFVRRRVSFETPSRLHPRRVSSSPPHQASAPRRSGRFPRSGPRRRVPPPRPARPRPARRSARGRVSRPPRANPRSDGRPASGASRPSPERVALCAETRASRPRPRRRWRASRRRASTAPSRHPSRRAGGLDEAPPRGPTARRTTSTPTRRGSAPPKSSRSARRARAPRRRRNSPSPSPRVSRVLPCRAPRAVANAGTPSAASPRRECARRVAAPAEVAPRYPTSARTRSRTFFFHFMATREVAGSIPVRSSRGKKSQKKSETDTCQAPTFAKTNKQFLAFLATLDRGVSAAARGRRKSHAPARFRVI